LPVPKPVGASASTTAPPAAPERPSNEGFPVWSPWNAAFERKPMPSSGGRPCYLRRANRTGQRSTIAGFAKLASAHLQMPWAVEGDRRRVVERSESRPPVSTRACPHTKLRRPMRVAGLPGCLAASQASAVLRGRLSLDRHSTRALTRGAPTIGGMPHAIEHLSDGKASPIALDDDGSGVTTWTLCFRSAAGFRNHPGPAQPKCSFDAQASSAAKGL